MEDTYTHSSFTLLQTTELIREVVDHVLRQPGPEVSQELRNDLTSWRDRKGGGGETPRDVRGEDASSESVEDITSNISFALVKRAHKQLAKTPLGAWLRTCTHLLDVCKHMCTLIERQGMHVCACSMCGIQ